MTREDTAFRPGPAWTIAFLLAFMMLVNFLDKVVIGLVAVPMTEELGLSPTEFGLIGGALRWLFAASAVVGGFLANRRPTRTLLLGMGLFWALIQLPMLLASSLWMIVACRVLLGIGEGPASPWPLTRCTNGSPMIAAACRWPCCTPAAPWASWWPAR